MRLPPSRLKEIDDALDDALGLPSHQRAAFVARLADRDDALAGAVAALLAEAEATDSRLAAVGRPDLLFAFQTVSSGGDLSSGDEVGRFRVLRELGRGGMAIVYLAERADGAFDQRVAIKRLHHGLGTIGALQRFDQEKQILATLSHPSIARLLDGDVDASGFPYLVMEYVECRSIAMQTIGAFPCVSGSICSSASPARSTSPIAISWCTETSSPRTFW